jgi:alpha-glucosidase (family GH31 glycosyl hydrolase)
MHANNYTELDTHSLFGTMEVKTTHDWFKKNNNRTLIIERSAFAGLGKFGSRWLGDNVSNK